MRKRQLLSEFLAVIWLMAATKVDKRKWNNCLTVSSALPHELSVMQLKYSWELVYHVYAFFPFLTLAPSWEAQSLVTLQWRLITRSLGHLTMRTGDTEDPSAFYCQSAEWYLNQLSLFLATTLCATSGSLFPILKKFWIKQIYIVQGDQKPWRGSP